MHRGHVYNHSGYVFVCDQSAADRRQSEHPSAEFSRQPLLRLLSHTQWHTCARVTRHLFLPLRLPPWRDPFSEWKTCLDISEIYISARTRRARLLRLKEEKGGKKRWISKYTGMSSVNIRHYGPALFMKLPLSSSALLSISHMKRPPALNNIHRRVRSRSLFHTHTHTSDLWLLSLQYTHVWWTIWPTSAEQREQTWGWLGYSSRLSFH